MKKGERSQGDVIRCKGHVIGSRQVTGRCVTQPAGDVPRVLSLEVFYVPAIKENRQEKNILFQTLVSGAVIMIRPPTSSKGDRKHLRVDLFQPA